jgi:CHASE2 domain-containing sensor protein
VALRIDEIMMRARFAFAGRASKPRSFPTRLLLWSFVVGALFGVLGVGEPLENLMRVGRNLSRSHAASGNIVIAGIDNATLSKFAAWPLPRRDRTVGR